MKIKAPSPSDVATGSLLDLALQFDPFQDDFGDPGDRTLRDKILKTRKPSECAHCGEIIPVGSFIRARTDVIDGEMMSWKWCHTCTRLMARAESKDVTISMPAEDEYGNRCKANGPSHRCPHCNFHFRFPENLKGHLRWGCAASKANAD